MTSKLISLDVFDTAIFRTVYEPTDIFKLVEKEVGNDFYKKRIEAERKAATKFKFYNLADIYSFLKPEFEPSVEIEMELNCCMGNEKLIKKYNKNPKKFIFISDMYLPSYIIESMLKSVGYKNPKVYVSCEVRANKGGGELFKKVQEITGKEIGTHYGDNYIADIEGAKLAGIKNVVFNPALHTTKLSLPMVKDPILKKMLALMEYNNPKDRIVFTHAPLVSEFTKWVLSQRKLGQKIFFLSRDMYVPYKLAKDVLGAEDVFYLHASRRSLADACLQSSNKEIKDRISLIFSEEEIKRRKQADTSEILKYLKQFNSEQ